MALRSENVLILTLTRRCDRRCGFCPQEFANLDMSESTLDAALEGLLPRLSPPRRVKLTGGEPLLRPDLAARALDRIAALAPGTTVELHTHGGNLAAAAAALALHPRTELFISRLLPEAARLPGATHNFMLMPEEELARSIARFFDARALGFARFSLVPAYFTAWTPAALAGLRSRFSALSLALITLAERGRRAEIVNSARSGSTTLFDEGLVVDADGEIYASTMALTAAAASRRHGLRLGSVSMPSFLSQSPEIEPAGFLAQSFPPEIVASTLAADAALTEFCRTLGHSASPSITLLPP